MLVVIIPALLQKLLIKLLGNFSEGSLFERCLISEEIGLLVIWVGVLDP